VSHGGILLSVGLVKIVLFVIQSNDVGIFSWEDMRGPGGKTRPYGFRKDTLREGYGKKKKASLLACLLRYP